MFYMSMTDRADRKPSGKQRLDTFIPIGHPDLPALSPNSGDLPSARVSWLALLDHIVAYQWSIFGMAFEIDDVRLESDGSTLESGKIPKLEDYFNYLSNNHEEIGMLTVPVATKKVISWDFMP